MHKPKVAAEEYIQFLVASPAAVSGMEAARVHAGPVVAHDAYTRLLHRLEPDAATLWQEAQGLVTPQGGVLVLDTRRSTSPTPNQWAWSPATGRVSTTPSCKASTC